MDKYGNLGVDSPSSVRIDRMSRMLKAEEYYRAFMVAVGLPLNNGTSETPMRVAKMFVEEFTSFDDPLPAVKLFENPNYDQYIVEKNIAFSSLCEHHHLPFTGKISIGYHPKAGVAGLSKLARVVKHFSHRPQIQERLTVQIAEYLFEELQPHGVMVVCEAAHTCMSVRGVRDPASVCTTSKLLEEEEGALDKGEMLRLMGL
jgi:GTP cyclohydrolase IA